MTGLLILITLLLIVMLIGMICLATLYYSLYKGFVALKTVSEEVFPVQNEVINEINSEMDSFLQIIKNIEDKALECYGLSERVLKDAEENKEFAMTTIRSARSMMKKIEDASKALDAEMETFKFEEKEEDPEDPRS